MQWGHNGLILIKEPYHAWNLSDTNQNQKWSQPSENLVDVPSKISKLNDASVPIAESMNNRTCLHRYLRTTIVFEKMWQAKEDIINAMMLKGQ